MNPFFPRTFMSLARLSRELISRPSLQACKQEITFWVSMRPGRIVRPDRLPRKYWVNLGVATSPPSGEERRYMIYERRKKRKEEESTDVTIWRRKLSEKGVCAFLRKYTETMESYFSQTFRLKEKHEKKLHQLQHEKKKVLWLLWK